MKGTLAKVTRSKPSPAQIAQRKKAAQAERILHAVLKTPKTRAGLIAAVVDKGSISKHYVFGWLSTRRRDGTLVVINSGHDRWYQIAQEVVIEVPKESVYPSWLEPRALPVPKGRRLFVDGAVVNTKENSNKKDKK